MNKQTPSTPKTSLRLAAEHWEPSSTEAARDLSLECIGRAQALASVLAAYAGPESDVEVSDLRECLALLADLCHLGYGPMVHWWDTEDDLRDQGWQPPSQLG
jgi:hypothetical protein